MAEDGSPKPTEGSAELGQRVFDQAMELWILPEVDRRQASGQLEKPLALRKAQVVFHTDDRGREVRLNDETRIVATIRTARERVINKGDDVYDEDIAGIEAMSLPEDDDPNAGHISLFHFRGSWHVAFDFRYNRGLIAQHLGAATQFLEAARVALREQWPHPFVDNLFSAAELGAKALLLGFMGVPPTKTTHRAIHSRFNQHAAVGAAGIEDQHRTTFNQLARARTTSRYLEGEPVYSPQEFADLLSAVEGLLELVRQRHSSTA